MLLIQQKQLRGLDFRLWQAEGLFYSSPESRLVQNLQRLSRLPAHSTHEHRCARKRSLLHFSIRQPNGRRRKNTQITLNNGVVIKIFIVAAPNGRRKKKKPSSEKTGLRSRDCMFEPRFQQWSSGPPLLHLVRQRSDSVSASAPSAEAREKKL